MSKIVPHSTYGHIRRVCVRCIAQDGERIRVRTSRPNDQGKTSCASTRVAHVRWPMSAAVTVQKGPALPPALLRPFWKRPVSCLLPWTCTLSQEPPRRGCAWCDESAAYALDADKYGGYSASWSRYGEPRALACAALQHSNAHRES